MRSCLLICSESQPEADTLKHARHGVEARNLGERKSKTERIHAYE